jgi:sucrose-6-phosphate hydrolase SacC (GH32 family)
MSPEFAIERNYINLLVGGGNQPEKAFVQLLIDGKQVRTVTGADGEDLEWRTWDVSEFAGKKARIEVVDQATGGWGHINVDQIEMSDKKEEVPVKIEALYQETWRPQFHFTARKNWLNDPNGLTFYGGEYHLFYQHNPFGTAWGNMSWGHSVSRDLLHWEELPIALEPDALGTCFSGSAVVDVDNTAGFAAGDEKTLVAIYTAAPVPPVPNGPKFTQCIAYSNDMGRTWTRYSGNPVLAHIVGDNRDPRVFWHAPTKKWVMALYLDKDAFAFFGSANLKEWEKLSDFTLPGSAECPDIFEMPVDGNRENMKWVFLAASGDYMIGSFDGRVFTPETPKLRGDYGANYYASQTYNNIPTDDGRRIQIAWMNGGSYPKMPFNQQMNIPAELTLRTTLDGIRMFRWPVRELETLYGRPVTKDSFEVKKTEVVIDGLASDLFDLEVAIRPGDCKAIGIRLWDDEIVYDVRDQTLACRGKSAPCVLRDGVLSLRVLVDRSSVEVFANKGEVVMSFCFLPKHKDSGVAIYAQKGSAQVESLISRDIKPVWP